MILPSTCFAKGCHKMIHARNYCEKHYKQLLKFGFVDILPKSRQQKCQKCNNQIGARGSVIDKLCRKHYEQTKNIKRARKYSSICSVQDCTNKHFTKGYCKMHWGRLYRNGTLERKTKKWKEGNINSKGYLIDASYKPIHRTIIEKKLGRILDKKEMVHHIDMDKLNNNIKNLHLCSKDEHYKLHQQFNQLIPELFKLDIIRFDGTKYYITF